jgi:hypothetical protein
MKGRLISVTILIAVAVTACDKIPFLGGRSKTPPGDTTQVAQPEPADSQAMAQPEAAAPTPEQPAPRQMPPQTRQAPPTPARPAATQAEVPWTPPSSGTVSPGMSPEEVVQAWGAPVIERHAGDWTYMFFRNGCEARCGTFDLVLFQGGQVVDAVVRTPAHTYTGVSSSPPGTPGAFTPPQHFSTPIGAAG